MTSNSIKAISIAILTFLSLNHNLYAADSRKDSEIPPSNDSIEEVLVSDFRSGRSREIPISATVFNAQFINEITVQHFEELTHAVPNLNWAGGASRPRYFQIRGIGERSQYTGAPNPSVGFVIDDLDFSALGGIATLFDVEQVEVLRGPQGTRYGANALAGLIYIKYQQPTEEFDARLTASIGSDDARTLGTAFGGPINDALKYRAVIHKHTSNGFRENLFLNRDDTNNRDETSLRFKLNYAPGENWNTDLILLHVDLDNGYDAFAVDNSFKTHSNRPGNDSQLTKAAVLSVNGDLNDSVAFESITGAARSDIIFSFDGDWGNNVFWAPVIYDYFFSTERDRQNLSQELRFSSLPGRGLLDDSVSWVTGAIISNNKESNFTSTDGNFEGFLELTSIAREYEATTSALFADVNYAFYERATINAGLRFEKRDADYQDSNGDAFNPSENSIGGQIALNYELNKQTNLYAKLARGYKAGGFNLGLPAETSSEFLLFDAEFLWNYELGLKGKYLDDRLALNASVFWMQRKDQQVETSTQLVPGNPLTFLPITQNAGKGNNRGLEIDANFDISESFSLYANLGLLDTEVDSPDGIRDGRDQAHAPNYTYALGGRYSFANNWFARVDVSGKDKFFFSDSHDQISNPYTLVNTKLGYEKDNWSLTAWGRNIFDKEYAVRGFFFGNEPALNFANVRYVRLGDPRQYGVSFEYLY